MRIWGKRPSLAFVAALAALLAVALASPAAAQKKAKSTQTEAVFLNFDETANTITVKVKKPGKGPNKSKVKKNEEVTFKVKPTGSVLTRTTVAINGVKGELAEIPNGKSVNVYWLPEGDVFFARKVDVVLSEEELDRRFESE